MDLSDLFAQYGPLVEVALLTTPDGKSKGAAFITFVERSDAERALRELQGYTFPNSSRGINISFATKQTRPHIPVARNTSSSPSYRSEEPMTPPGFTTPTPPTVSFSPPSNPHCLTTTTGGGESPFSIFRKTSDLHPEMEHINEAMLKSLFGDISDIETSFHAL